jgi:hypothetical protein
MKDYMNDLRLLNDPDMKDALEPVKEVHAIRLRLQDEMAGMTPQQQADSMNASSRDFLARIGMSAQLVNRSGMGRLPTRHTATV